MPQLRERDRVSYRRAVVLVATLDADAHPYVLHGAAKAIIFAMANDADAARVASEGDGLEDDWLER